MKTRILPLLLALCLLAGSLIGCGTQNEVQTTTADTAPATETTAETEAPAPTGLTVVALDGTTQFSILRPDMSDTTVTNASMELHKAINEAFNTNVKLGTDWVKRGELDENGMYTSDACEILIGETNRVETVQAKEQMGKSDYIITVIGNKIVILGVTAFSTKYAVEQFIDELKSASGASFVLADDYLRTGDGESRGVNLTDGADFRIMTFNVLGSGTDPDKRYPNIMQVIQTYGPDIIGFQEFNAAQHSNTMAPLLRDGYAVSCQKHANGTTYNYTPIAYRKDKFTQIEGGVEWLDSRYTGTNTKSVSWAVLKTIEGGKVFAVINIHGAVLSNDYKGYETMSSAQMNEIVRGWRVDNVRQLLEIQDRLRKAHGDIPVLYTGDFNFTASSEAYNAMKAAGLTEAEISSTGAKVTGTKTTHAVGSAPAAGSSIDHVFYHPDLATALWHHVAKSETFELAASDHCAVMADIVLK